MSPSDAAELLTAAITAVDTRVSPTGDAAHDAALDRLAVVVERLSPATTVAECRSIADAVFDHYCRSAQLRLDGGQP